MGQNNHSQIDAGNGGKGSPGGTGIGALLKDERGKKGFSYARIFDMIRLRPHILEALENEDWGSLPSPVFVRGFVRSYARVLGLEEGKALALYQKAVPFENTPLSPLVKSVRRRSTLSVTLIFLLLAGVSSYFFWKDYQNREEVLINPATVFSVGDEVTKSEDIQEVPMETIPRLPNQQNEMDLAPKTYPEIIDIQIPMEDALPLESEPAPGVETPGLILKANVGESTWLRISVDDQDPKEYILHPGSYPEWRAKEGFELLVGNAGGIELEFNGEKIMNLGDPGQVIRLKLP